MESKIKYVGIFHLDEDGGGIIEVREKIPLKNRQTLRITAAV